MATQRPNPVLKSPSWGETLAKRPATQQRKVDEWQLMCSVVVLSRSTCSENCKTAWGQSSKESTGRAGSPPTAWSATRCDRAIHPLAFGQQGAAFSCPFYMHAAGPRLVLAYLECLLVVYCFVAALRCQCQADGFCLLFCFLVIFPSQPNAKQATLDAGQRTLGKTRHWFPLPRFEPQRLLSIKLNSAGACESAGSEQPIV